jgi:hypothetical protein
VDDSPPQTTQEQRSPMCEHREQLQKAAYELQQQQGNGIINLGKLRHMLSVNNEECKHGGNE